MVDRGPLLRHHRARPPHRRVVQPVPGRLVPELHRHQGARRQRGRAQRAELITIVGGHAGNGPIIGDVDFGPDSKFDEDAATLDLVRLPVQGREEPVRGQAREAVRDGREPVARRGRIGRSPARADTKYFLHSDGKANSLRGGGTLSTTAPAAETADQYVFDPENPVPTIGGPLCCDGSHLKPGPRDQRPAEARDDVLVYSTPPLAADMEVTGPVTLELFAKSSAVDTDFTAKLVDVRPDGFAQNMTEGILRARYRDSQERPSLITPGQVYKMTVGAAGPRATCSRKATCFGKPGFQQDGFPLTSAETSSSGWPQAPLSRAF